MKKARYDKELEREKEKLNKLVGEAFNKGTPFTEDEAVMEQNCKVDTLVVKIQKEKRKQNKNQMER
ncbi:MAG TPA: hypothetical protein GXZ71_09475 [Clostridiaceae bacterium]|nr:hypothetical protein [Clostridiaceae bacterium]